MDTPSSLPEDSTRIGGVDISGDAHVTARDIIGGDQILGYTAEQVRVLIADLRASYQPKPFDGRSPYVGLAPFQEQDAARFFGREKLTEALVARIRDSRFLVIAGPSGSGKSSLARAGLIPALKRGDLPGSENWLYETLAPGRHPLAGLGRVVASLTGHLNAGDEIQQNGRADATLLHRWAEIALGDQRARRAILLIDQFEETFTQVADEAERAAFLEHVTCAATAAEGRVTIVCATRSDFIGNWAAYPNLNALLSHGVNQIPPMQADELVSAVARPALQVGLQVDPALVKQILDDMRDAPGALPLLQFALDDLFEYARSKGSLIALTRDDYLARGGLQKALERHADAEFAKLSADEQQIARTVFAGLIEPGRGTVDTKRTALFHELVPAESEPALAQKVISKLADARLVTTGERDQHETVTLAHERLIDAWAWLRRLVDENREAISLQNQIAGHAQEWAQQDRDPSYLYTGARLATAREQLHANKIRLSALAQEFVDAGAQANAEYKRREAQRTRRLIVAFGAAAAVFALLAILAFFLWQGGIASEKHAQAESTRAVSGERNAEAAAGTAEANRKLAEARQAEAVAQKNEAQRQQRIARSRELAALAVSQFDSHPDLAILLAIEANKQADAITFESEDALRRLLTAYPRDAVLLGHEADVLSAVFSPDGNRIVTASADATARVWDATGGGELLVLRGHADDVLSAQFSPDGSTIVTASADHTARVWDSVSGKQLLVLSGHADVVADARFSPDGTRIVTSSADHTARLWNAASGQELAVLRGHTGELHSARFSPDGNRIVTASADATARVWDGRGGGELLVLRGHADDVLSAQFSPDGSRIVTASADATARVWDTASGEQLTVLRGHAGVVADAGFSPDGTRIATAGADATARVWDTANGEELVALRGHTGELYSARFSPDGTKIVTAGADKTVRLWFSVGGAELAVLRGHADVVWSAQFSADGTKIVTASRDHTARRVWDSDGGKELAVLRGHADVVWSAQFSQDANNIVTASSDKTARVWDVASGEVRVILRGHEKELNTAQFSPDGTKIVTASDDHTARIWDSVTGRQLVVLRGHENVVWTAQFSPDGSKIVTASDDRTARVWDSVGGEPLLILRGHADDVLSAYFSPDGTKIVTASADRTARVWDSVSGEPLLILRGHESHIFSAQFSPDGSKIVTASYDRTARVWDSASGEQLLILRGHEGAVDDARFSPDGSKIVTASWDKTARVWDAVSAEPLSVLRGHEAELNSAAFSPDGIRIVTTGWDNTARIFLVSIEDLLELAEKRSGRELTCAEREQYLQEDNVCPTPIPQASPTP